MSHYGWVCDPNEKPMENFVRMGEAVDLEGEATEAVTEDQCCSTDCVEAEFQQTRKEALKQTGSTEFYVDFQRGDDAALGTRELPWRTLKRAQDKVRALRVASSDDLKLAHPVQVWVKDPSSWSASRPVPRLVTGGAQSRGDPLRRLALRLQAPGGRGGKKWA